MPEDTTSNAPPPGESEEDIIGDLVAQHADKETERLASKGKADEADGADGRVRSEPDQEPSKDARERPGQKQAKDDEAVEHDEHLSAKALKGKLDALLAKNDIDGAFALLGKKAEDFGVNSGKLVAIRQHEQRERQKTRAGQSALLGQQQELQTQIRAAVDRLTPYEQYYEAEQAYARTGDTGLIRKIVAGLMKAPNYSEANKRLLHDDKHSPAEMRMAQKLEQLERQIQERDQASQQQRQERTVQEQRSADLAHIRKNLRGHDAAKLPRFEERVYRVLEKHFDPRVGLQITLDEAAERVVRGEKRRLERSPFYQAPADGGAGKASQKGSGGGANGAGSSNRAPLRRDSQNNGAKPQGEEDIDDIVADIQGQIARQKLAERKTPRA
jgi:hypothetical protein